MKPRTKLEKRVAELSNKLPEIKENKASWGYKFLNKKHYGRKTARRETITCFECAHSFKNKSLAWQNEVVKPVCPKCNNELKLVTETELTQVEYVTIFDYKEEFQIVRLVYISKYLSKGNLPVYSFSEVMQHWIRTDGKVTIMAKDSVSQFYNLDAWCKYSEMSIKIPCSMQATQRLNLFSLYVAPRKKIHPTLIRNGFKVLFPILSNYQSISFLLLNKQAETLLKSGQIQMFKYFSERPQNLPVFWDSIKICIRNNYKPKSIGTWYDYMTLLSYFNKDVRNLKYVCPVDLDLAHDRLVAKKREIQIKEDILKMKLKIEEFQLKYNSVKKDFFGLEFKNKDGDICIRFIEKVEDFVKEGDELKHCLFANEYYEKKNSLIFSATVKGKRTETIEFKIDSMKVLQSRGIGNKATKYNSQILELMNSSIPLIRKRLKKKKSPVNK